MILHSKLFDLFCIIINRKCFLLLLLLFQPHFPFSLTTAIMAPGPQDAKLSMTGEEN